MKGKNNFSILLIEDDEKTVQTICFALKNEGFGVLIVRDGQEAIEAFEEKNFKPDLVLLDLVLPKLSGFEVLKKLSQKKIKIPIIVLSNLGQDADREKAFKLGADDYLVKGRLSIEELTQRIKELRD